MMKDEAKEAFTSVQESFASVGEEQTKMKEGLHGLASKIDEVQGKAAEEVAALAQAADEAFSQAGFVTSELSTRLADAERRQAAATSAAERAQAASDAALLKSVKARCNQQLARAQLEADLQIATLQSQTMAELWRWHCSAHRGSQIPVHSQFVDKNGIQPRVRQQAVTFISLLLDE